MFDLVLRFLAGGIAVSAFAALGDALRPRTFAGLFGAAPSIALATILLTLTHEGRPFVATEARSMILGAVALGAYGAAVCALIRRAELPALPATVAALPVWLAAAFGATAVLIGAP